MKTLTGGEGHAGHPTRATAEKGRRMIEVIIQGTATYLKATLEIADRYDRYCAASGISCGEQSRKIIAE